MHEAGPLEHPGTRVTDSRPQEELKADLRTKSDAQVILRSTVEIDHVANIQAQAERTPKSFNTGSRINRELRVPIVTVSNKGILICGHADVEPGAELRASIWARKQPS